MADPASLIFEDNRPAETAGVHAIVVGVGHYRHFPGGAGNEFSAAEGMTQLSSPPHSARHIVDWLFDTYHDDDNLPLRSVHLLASKKAGQASFKNRHVAKTPVPEATIGNIKAGVADWFARGDRNEQNLLVFYFCGHGISASHQHTLLCTDFGGNPLDEFDDAIDFTDFRLGMARCKADSQMFLVDACRTISQSLIESASSKGQSLVRSSASVARRSAPVFRSALPGKEAFGLPGKASAFAQAVPLAFRGGSWDKVEGEWVVCTSKLRRALEHQIRRVMRDFPNYVAKVDGDGDVTMTIKIPDGVPVVPVDVGGKAIADLEVSDLYYEADDGSRIHRPPSKHPVWLLDLEEGVYTFFATFDGPQGAKTGKKSAYVTPQNVSERIRPK